MKQNSLFDEKLGEMIQLYDMGYSMVLLYDENGTILKWNAAAQQSLNLDCMSGKLNMVTLIPDLFHMYGDQIYISLDNQMVNVKTLLYPEGRDCIPVELKVYKRSICGFFVGICVVHDLSERMQNNIEKTKIMNRMTNTVERESEFLAQITHDLKTPVNGIYGLVEAMEGQTDQQEAKECLKMVKDCCNHMRDMINQVLEHEELSHGGSILQEEYVDLYRVIEVSSAIHRKMAEREGLQFYANVSANIPKLVYTDRLKIVEIINNLMTNAIKFTQIGFVTLNAMCAKIEDNIITILFMIQDTGTGIKPERIKEIFEPYHHEACNRNYFYGGTGLGLSIVKNLVDLFRGSIKVESYPGIGSRFYFTIKAKLEREETVKGPGTAPSEDNMEELAQRMEETMSLEIEKKHYNRIMRTKTFGTKENKMEIIHNLQAICQSINQDKWELIERAFLTLKLLIPETQQELRNQLFRAELCARRNDREKTLEYVNWLEKWMKAV